MNKKMMIKRPLPLKENSKTIEYEELCLSEYLAMQEKHGLEGVVKQKESKIDTLISKQLSGLWKKPKDSIKPKYKGGKDGK